MSAPDMAERDQFRDAAEMVHVKKEDANNYCRVLRALGMEDEGNPVAEIELLLGRIAALECRLQEIGDLAASSATGPAQFESLKFIEELCVLENQWESCAKFVSAARQPVGAAEVPMPEPVGWIGWIRHDEGGGRHPMFSTYEPTAYEHRDQVAAMPDVRTYGDAREAAGYARGLAAGPPKDCGDAGHDEGRCGNASCGRSAQAGLVGKVIEQRLRTWRQSRMNKSGDRLSLDDFMGPDSIDDLVDCVCDEFAIGAALRGEVK